MTILQPYVPEYRVALFDLLAELLARDGLRLQIAHASAAPAQAARNDAAQGSWSVPLTSHAWHVAGQDLTLRHSWRTAAGSAVVVAELASTNLDTLALASARPSRLILWGHGRSYVTAHNRLDDAVERWLARRSQHVLLYSESGRDHLARRGIPSSKMSVLHNSTDTRALRALTDALTDADVADFAARHRMIRGSTAVYIGAFDASKNLPLLFAASSLVRARRPDFRLVLAGDGPLRGYVHERARAQPEVLVLPRATGRSLALLGAAGDLCVCPGRVGLVAVDAMTLGLPVVTTDYAFHAPERDYLRPAFSWVTSQDPADYADLIGRLLNDPAAVRAAAAVARNASESYSVEYMAQRMRVAIRQVATR